MSGNHRPPESLLYQVRTTHDDNAIRLTTPSAASGRRHGAVPRVPRVQYQLDADERWFRQLCFDAPAHGGRLGPMAEERDRLASFALRVWGYKQAEGVSLMLHLSDRLGLYPPIAGRCPTATP